MTINEIRARRAAITPGEWYWDEGDGQVLRSKDREAAVISTIYYDRIWIACEAADAEFIAAAPADIELLLATIDRLTAENEALKARTELQVKALRMSKFADAMRHDDDLTGQVFRNLMDGTFGAHKEQE